MNARTRDSHRAERELLSGSQLLSGLPPEVLDELAAASRLVELSANETLYQAGDAVQSAHLLFTGTVKRMATRPGATPKVIELALREQLLGPGEIFAATHHASTCAAVTPSLLVAIDLRALQAAIARSHELAGRIILTLAQRQCATEFDLTGYHYGLTGAQRVLDYLLELAGERAGLAGETSVLLKASKKTIAARIGMTPESFSRNLRELTDSGVIVVDGRNVHIQNAALLDTDSGHSGRRLNFSRKRRNEGGASASRLSPGVLVNLCGRLRLLSQRQAVSWAMIAAGVSPLRAEVKLRQLDKECERILGQLARADLPPGVAIRLKHIETLWPGYRQAMASTLPADAKRVFDLSEDVLLAADALTTEAERAVDMPAAHYVNIAGRNRMLSQRIGKIFMFREWEPLQARIAPLSAPSCEEFERNLRELQQSGNRLPELNAQLQVVAIQWQKYLRALNPGLENAGPGRHARIVLAEGERLLRHVDTAVKLFERLTQ